MDALLGGREKWTARWKRALLLARGRHLCCWLGTIGFGEWMHCWVGERSGLLGGRGLCCWLGRRGGG